MRRDVRLNPNRTRLVASGFGLPTALEALVFAPWTDAAAELNPDRAAPSARRADGVTDGATGAAPAAQTAMSTWVPAVDVEESEDAVRLAFEVPGVDPNALAVILDDRVLTVSGERAARARPARARTAWSAATAASPGA